MYDACFKDAATRERVQTSMKHTDVIECKEGFSSLANVLVNGTGGRQVVLPPDTQALAVADSGGGPWVPSPPPFLASYV